MELVLYKTTSQHNVIGKVLTSAKTYNINLKKTEPIESPHIRVTVQGELSGYNYAYLPYFKRYYFIDNVERGNYVLVDLYLSVDVLESYKNDILHSQAIITKSSKKTLFSQGATTSADNEVLQYDSDTELPETSTIVLATIGG